MYNLISGFFWYKYPQEEVSLGKSLVNHLSGPSVLGSFAATQPHYQQHKNSLCKWTSYMHLHKLQSHTEIKCNQIYTEEVPWMLSWSPLNLEMVMEVDLLAQRLKILTNIKERICHLGQGSFSMFPSAHSLEVLVQRFEWGQETLLKHSWACIWSQGFPRGINPIGFPKLYPWKPVSCEGWKRKYIIIRHLFA